MITLETLLSRKPKFLPKHFASFTRLLRVSPPYIDAFYYELEIVFQAVEASIWIELRQHIEERQLALKDFAENGTGLRGFWNSLDVTKEVKRLEFLDRQAETEVLLEQRARIIKPYNYTNGTKALPWYDVLDERINLNLITKDRQHFFKWKGARYPVNISELSSGEFKHFKTSFIVAPTSNLRLFGVGLLLALLSSVYPRLPHYLPSRVSSHLPFITTSSSLPHLNSWSSIQRFQKDLPAPANHDPFDLKEPEAERQRRLLSEDGVNQLKKEEKRLQRDWEKRMEMAGQENKIHEELPVYFLNAPTSQGSSIDPHSSVGRALSAIGEEIVADVRPKSIILLIPIETNDAYVQISTLDQLTYTTSSGSRVSLQGSPSLAHSLTTTLAYASPPVHAVSGRQNLHSSTWPIIEALFGSSDRSKEYKFVQVTIPVMKQGGWDSEQYFDIGHAMIKTRRNEGDLVVIGVGELKVSKPGPSYSSFLTDALAHHTNHPRLVSLVSLINASSGKKPSRQVPIHLAALYAAIGAAGEGEGEKLDREGTCWRFGHLPIEKNRKYMQKP